jgi:hypothetical protein
MTVEATHAGEEVHVTFHARTERSDYGVPGSPVWDEVDPSSVEIATLSILGVDVDPRVLPDDLVEAIRSLSDDLEFA